MTDEVFDPVITVAGEPSGMGRQHGSLLGERIQRTVAGMRVQVGPEPYRASVDGLRETLAYCRRKAPELVAEMEGIAEGAAVDFDDVFRLNAHLDLMTWKRLAWERATGCEAGGCSTHAVATPSAVLLGWNGDDWRGWLGCGAVVRGRPERGEPFIYWSLAGSVGRPGMNLHLALGANSLPSRRFRPDGLLYPMVCRKLLACRDTEEAKAILGTHGRCSAMNYLVADRGGRLVDFESTPDGWASIEPVARGGCRYLLHTNGYLDPRSAGMDSPQTTALVWPPRGASMRSARRRT